MKKQTPIVIIGLGNPGSAYVGTRHNTGLRTLQKFFSGNRRTCLAWKIRRELSARISEGMIEEQSVVLTEPTTYYNDTGKVVVKILRATAADPAHLIVIHDELDVPVGMIKISRHASAAGNNGIASIINALGTKDFVRIRIGIGGSSRPADPATYVLEKFHKNELPLMKKAIGNAIEALAMLVRQWPDIAPAQNKYH